MNGMKDKLYLTIAAIMILAGTAAACSTSTQAEPNPALPPATAEITRTTLVETRTVPGTLGYGDPVPLNANASGTITWIAPVGSTVERGDVLFKVDEQPVVAFYGDVPMYRPLDAGTEGADVQQLEENLAELGYSGFAVDGVYNSATAEAMRAWQEDVGLPETGFVEPGQLVFISGPARIAEHAARVGDVLGGGNPGILSYTGTDRMVTVVLRVADRALAVEGNTVAVTVPGVSVVEGTISEVSTAVREQQLEIIVTVTIADQGALGELDAAPVEVDFISEAREDVLAVPVAALLALAEGGYGVELVDDDTTRIVPVTTGMFAAGKVEISGEEIAEGMLVGAPR